jgi:Domain of unknown function (DUF1788)
MNDSLNERLNQILPRVTSDDFLSGSGIGNEVAFYIFDYPPEEELRVRKFLSELPKDILHKRRELRVKHINLFDFVLDYLKTRKLLDKAIQMQREKGDDALKKALAGPLHPEKLLPYFAKAIQPQEHGLVILSGVGSVYPLLRTSSLLSNLQRIMGSTPLVMFYPGKYDQLTLRLFGKLTLSASFEGEGKGKKSEHYYRAFKLVP